MTLPNYDFAELWLCQIMTFPNYDCRIMTLLNYDFAELWLCRIMTLLNYYFAELWLRRIMTSPNYDFAELWLCRIMTLPNYVFTKLWLCQIQLSGESFLPAGFASQGFLYNGPTVWQDGANTPPMRGKSAASFCCQMAAWFRDMFWNFYLVKNHKIV